MTSTDETLLRAILTDPADDTPRLALADWLEEHAGDAVRCNQCDDGWRPKRGIPDPGMMSRCPTCHGTGRIPDGRAERAEFIRVQVELARMPLCGGGDILSRGHCKTCARVYELRRRERELWEGVWSSLWEFLCPLIPGYTILDRRPTRLDCGEFVFNVSRGFISELRLPLAAFTDDLARRVFSAEPVTTVRISNKQPYEEHGTFGWCDAEDPDSDGNSHIGKLLWGLLPDDERVQTRFSHYKDYPTLTTALSALSRVCVNHGRSLVGLDALPAEATGVRT